MLIAWLSCLIHALDAVFEKGGDQEVKSVQDELLQPDTILFLLLLSDALAHLTVFCYFCKEKILISVEIASKFTKLKRSIDELKNKDGQLFCQHSDHFYRYLRKKMELAQWLQGNNQIPASEEEIDVRIKEF